MTYGDGSVLFHPLSGSLDVVAHEIGHGFTAFHSNLTYSGQSGGMNESFSDIAGEAAEAFYLNAAPDWNVGRDIMRSGNGLRFLCDPTADGVSIDHISQYTSGIDVHYSSGIRNKAFCRTARRFASGSPTGAATLASVKRASRAGYVANILYWTPSSTFQQGCQGVFDAATAMGYTATEQRHLQQSWTDVGITCGTATPAAVSFAINNASGEEGNMFLFTVNKTGSDGLSHSKSFATANGTATSPQDYCAISGTLTFAPNETSKTISVVTRRNARCPSPERPSSSTSQTAAPWRTRKGWARSRMCSKSGPACKTPPPLISAPSAEVDYSSWMPRVRRYAARSRPGRSVKARRCP